MPDDPALDRTILLLIAGYTPDQLRTQAQQLQLPPDRIDNLIATARRRITAAADYDLRHELGLAIRRLRELFRRALSTQDLKVALAAQKEMHRLLQLDHLRPQPTTDQHDPAAARARDLLLAALTPRYPTLDLSHAPLDELARLAQQTIAQL